MIYLDNSILGNNFYSQNNIISKIKLTLFMKTRRNKVNILKPGMKAIDFPFSTPWERRDSFLQEPGNIKILFFLRFYGCRISQVDMMDIRNNYKKIINKENDINIFIVLQTEGETIKKHEKKNDSPYNIICDPKHHLYKLYNVKPRKSKEKPVSNDYDFKLNKAIRNNIIKIPNYGKENKKQLPATFIINSKNIITHVKYGVHSGDILSIKDILSLL